VCAPRNLGAKCADGGTSKNFAATVLLILTVGVTSRCEDSRDPGSSEGSFGDMTLPVWAARCASFPPSDGALRVVFIVGFSIAVAFTVMATMMVVVVMVTVPMVVVIARHRILLLAALASVRANLARLAMIVVLAITRALPGKGKVPIVRVLLPNDDCCRGCLL